MQCDTPDPKLNIILTQHHLRRRHIPNRNNMHPKRLVSRSPHNFIPNGTFHPIPLHLTIIRQSTSINRHILGTIWRYDQTPGRGPSYLTYAGDVVVIAELRQVAVLYAVGEEHVLVLMCEVLAGLGEARCGVASGGCCW
jgi:hypothetical protein